MINITVNDGRILERVVQWGNRVHTSLVDAIEERASAWLLPQIIDKMREEELYVTGKLASTVTVRQVGGSSPGSLIKFEIGPEAEYSARIERGSGGAAVSVSYEEIKRWAQNRNRVYPGSVVSAYAVWRTLTAVGSEAHPFLEHVFNEDAGELAGQIIVAFKTKLLSGGW